MKNFEQILLEEINRKREEQWDRCKLIDGYVKKCTLYGGLECPNRCDYAINKGKLGNERKIK